MEEEKNAEILLEIGAVSLNPTNPFKYASGMFSPIYTDCRILNSYPEQRKIIIDEITKFVEKEIDRNNIDVIVGTAHSGISLATYVAQRLRLPAGYIRTSVKEHGKQKQIEGTSITKGSRALLISDIMSTEQDIPISVATIKNAGGKIIYCLTIFSNNLGFIEEFLKREKIDFSNLTDLKTLLQVALQKKKISKDQANCVIEWMRNPKEWNKHRRNRVKKMLVRNNEKIAEILLQIETITFNTKSPYEFAHGISSPIYVDNRLLMAYPRYWQDVIDSMLNLIVDQIGMQNVDIIAGTSTAGVSHAAYLAERLGLPMVYVKSKTDEYGKFTRVEGRVERNDKVLVIEDTISTGRSSISSAKALKKAGGLVEHCLAIFDYGLKDSKNAFGNEKIKLTALTNLNTVLDIAVVRNHLTQKEREIITKWAKKPHAWKKEYNL